MTVSEYCLAPKRQLSENPSAVFFPVIAFSYGIIITYFCDFVKGFLRFFSHCQLNAIPLIIKNTAFVVAVTRNSRGACYLKAV